MAPKVVVPADFGIENLHSQFHGNVVLKLQGGEDMKANSLILSYHSSVFVHLFLELQQSVLEMEDFVGEAVKSFLGALYSGEIQLVRHLFRDVNKLCHVFKVEWLSGRCWDYFTGLVGGVSVHTDYQTLLFLFEEARFCMRVMKCDKFVELVVQKICGLENRAEIFVEPYMKNYSELETSQLDLIIQITKCNPVSLLQIMKKNLESEGGVFNATSRYLLENVDLCKCISGDEVFLEDFFDVLDNATSSSDADAFIVNKLYRKSVKEYKRASFSSSTTAVLTNAASSASLSPHVQKATQIPHIFTSFETFLGMSIEDYVDAAKESPRVLNLYMLIEGLALNGECPTTETVLVIEHIGRKRGWSRISPEFLESLHPFFVECCNYIKENSSDLLSAVESVRRVGKIVGPENKVSKRNSCEVQDMFYKPQSFAFHFKHPNTIDCRVPGKCGFLLKCTPDMKSGTPHKFKVNLCLDQEEFPVGLHIHPEFVKVGNIHLVPMFGMYHHFDTITWNEFGINEVVKLEGSTLEWIIGCTRSEPEDPLKLIAFITL